MPHSRKHHSQKIQEPFILTIFGASGDLAKIKIFPALYEMAKQNRFPRKFSIIGFGRTALSRSEFQQLIRESIEAIIPAKRVDPSAINILLSKVQYFSGQYNRKEDFVAYKTMLKKLYPEKKLPPHIAYFSTPPVVFEDIIQNLAKTRSSKKEDLRLVIEKPFGTNKKSAEKLFHFVSRFFEEDQFYLLDHYLGKASVQSILNMRRSNRILSNLIQGSEIANIQITAFEKVGVEKRIGYFDQIGVTRDIIQSHLLQVLALVVMDIPKTNTAAAFQREKNNIIESIECPNEKNSVIVGQYSDYKKHPSVKKDSRTETFSALRLFLDKQHWQDTPIYIRTGKKLHEKHTYVVIELSRFDFQDKKEEPNRIIIEFYPLPKISISFLNYQEGVSHYQEIVSSASIACNIEGCLPEHANLLLDVLEKDRVHFLSFSEIISSWKVVDEIVTHIEKNNVTLHQYKTHSEGPKQQHRLPKQDGFRWYDLH